MKLQLYAWPSSIADTSLHCWSSGGLCQMPHAGALLLVAACLRRLSKLPSVPRLPWQPCCCSWENCGDQFFQIRVAGFTKIGFFCGSNHFRSRHEGESIPESLLQAPIRSTQFQSLSERMCLDAVTPDWRGLQSALPHPAQTMGKAAQRSQGHTAAENCFKWKCA
jgi:hypothetical protein